MFAPYCPQHGTRVLLSLSDIEALEQTENGLVVSYQCTCGHQGIWTPAPRAA